VLFLDPTPSEPFEVLAASNEAISGYFGHSFEAHATATEIAMMARVTWMCT
jgi:hypothetical protein